MPLFCADRHKKPAFYARTPPESVPPSMVSVCLLSKPVPPSAEVERMR